MVGQVILIALLLVCLLGIVAILKKVVTKEAPPPTKEEMDADIYKMCLKRIADGIHPLNEVEWEWVFKYEKEHDIKRNNVNG